MKEAYRFRSPKQSIDRFDTCGDCQPYFFDHALFLNKNHLIGSLPSQVGSLKNIGQLDVSGKKLNGTIPSSLGDFQVLEYLYLQDNFFEGTIPSTFERLKGIQVLNLSHNNLSGKIARLLGELPLIQNLDLSFNSLEGEVPDEEAFKNMSSFCLVGNTNLCGGIQALQLPTRPKDFPKDKGNRFPHKINTHFNHCPNCYIVSMSFCDSLSPQKIQKAE